MKDETFLIKDDVLDKLDAVEELVLWMRSDEDCDIRPETALFAVECLNTLRTMIKGQATYCFTLNNDERRGTGGGHGRTFCQC